MADPGVVDQHVQSAELPGRCQDGCFTRSYVADITLQRQAVRRDCLEFLSQGGGNEVTNRSGTCVSCHLRGIHRGFLRVTGRAGERLVWRFGAASDGEPVAVYVTEGKDDVRRVG